jgi:hypothetical protein
MAISTSFVKGFVQIICSFLIRLFVLLVVFISLYILNINPLSDEQAAKIFFSSPVDHLFILLIASFAVQNIFFALIRCIPIYPFLLLFLVPMKFSSENSYLCKILKVFPLCFVPAVLKFGAIDLGL